MASQLQIDANRQNAQKSSGPKTPAGKAAVSQNAMTHGLTAQLACINGEDMDEFDETRQSFENELKPIGPLQTLLLQQIVMAAYHRALHELQRLQSGPENKMTKQSQITPELLPQKDFTPPSEITESPNHLISELDDTLHKAHSAPLDGDPVAAVLTPKFAAAGGDLQGVKKRLVQALDQ